MTPVAHGREEILDRLSKSIAVFSAAPNLSSRATVFNRREAFFAQIFLRAIEAVMRRAKRAVRAAPTFGAFPTSRGIWIQAQDTRGSFANHHEEAEIALVVPHAARDLVGTIHGAGIHRGLVHGKRHGKRPLVVRPRPAVSGHGKCATLRVAGQRTDKSSAAGRIFPIRRRRPLAPQIHVLIQRDTDGILVIAIIATNDRQKDQTGQHRDRHHPLPRFHGRSPCLGLNSSFRRYRGRFEKFSQDDGPTK